MNSEHMKAYVGAHLTTRKSLQYPLKKRMDGLQS
jgi:hypothetical protein